MILKDRYSVEKTKIVENTVVSARNNYISRAAKRSLKEVYENTQNPRILIVLQKYYANVDDYGWEKEYICKEKEVAL